MSASRIALVAGPVALGVAVWGWGAASRHAERQRGKELFETGVALKGHQSGDDTALPAEALRCQNCHAPGTQALGPLLSPSSLQTPRPRRGGPASRYDEASFCRLLAEGVDPMQIVIPKTMPRYAVSPEQCQELWSYLTHQ